MMMLGTTAIFGKKSLFDQDNFLIYLYTILNKYYN